MRPLMRLVLGLVGLVAILAAVAVGLPAHVTVARSVVINAPESAVFPYVNNLHRLGDWSPWKLRDPQLTMTYGGPEEGKGAQIQWTSQKPSIGTGSVRRVAQLLSVFPRANFVNVRGNVDTRLRKLDEGLCDGLLMARAGLERLGLKPEHAHPLAVEEFLPAVGQGILGVEARLADSEIREALRGVDHPDTRMQAVAERAFLRRLGAGCHTPVAGHARLVGETLSIAGLVASVDGATMLTGEVSGPGSQAEALGERLADDLLERGARALLDGGSDAGGRA